MSEVIHYQENSEHQDNSEQVPTRPSFRRIYSESMLKIIDYLAKNGSGWMYEIADEQNIPVQTVRTSIHSLQKQEVIFESGRTPSPDGPERIVFSLTDSLSVENKIYEQQALLDERIEEHLKGIHHLQQIQNLNRQVADTMRELRLKSEDKTSVIGIPIEAN